MLSNNSISPGDYTRKLPYYYYIQLHVLLWELGNIENIWAIVELSLTRNQRTPAVCIVYMYLPTLPIFCTTGIKVHI